MTQAVFAGTILAVVAALATQTANAATYTYTKIAVPGADATVATGINDQGEVAGYYWVSSPQGGLVVYHGFAFLNGVITTIDPPASTNTQVNGINNDGTLIGYYQRGGANRFDGFVLRHGVYQHFGSDGFRTSFDAISNTGDIAGSAQSFGARSVKLFVRSGNKRTTTALQASQASFIAINDHGEVIGYNVDFMGKSGSFVGRAGEYRTFKLPGASFTSADAINDSGAIAGTYRSSLQSTFSGFIDRGGVVTTLNLPGSTQTFVQGINASGDVVGYADVGSASEVFVEHQGTYTLATPAGVTLTDPSLARYINASDQTAGTYVDSSYSGGYVAYLASPQ